MKRRLFHLLLATAALLLMAGCGENEYSKAPCRFVFNMNTHSQSAALLSTVNSKGIFCKVTKTIKGGATYYHFATNQGLSDDVIFTVEDQSTTVLLGLNGSVIFGYGNLDDPAVFYGYDGECPNCFDPNAIPVRSKPLTMSDAGMASCSVCKRKYNLNTGGNIVSGDNGSALTRYHAAYAASGVVTVTN